MTGTEASIASTAVVVVNYRSSTLLERNLSDLTGSGSDLHIVVVDSFASLGERAAVQALSVAGGWEFVPLDVNPGFGAACNEGAQRAIELGCQTMVFLNPDARLDTAGVRQLAERSALAERLLVGARIVRPDGSTWFDGAAVDRRHGIPGWRPTPDSEIPWLTGACLAVSTAWWVALGGFDGDYFMYWEDIDLSYRCAAAGGELVIVNDVVVVHDVGATQGAGKSTLYVRCCCRNRLLFAAKHLGRFEMCRWIAATPRSSWLIARRAARRRELVRSPRLLWAMVAGSGAGIFRVTRQLAHSRQAGSALRRTG